MLQELADPVDESDAEFDAILAAMSMASNESIGEEQQRMQFFDQIAEAESLLEEDHPAV
jgi:hypothetical protein